MSYMWPPVEGAPAPVFTPLPPAPAPAPAEEPPAPPSAAASEKDVEAEAAAPAGEGGAQELTGKEQAMVKMMILGVIIGPCVMFAGLGYGGYAIYKYAWLPHHQDMEAQKAGVGSGATYAGATHTGGMSTTMVKTTSLSQATVSSAVAAQTVTVFRTRSKSTADWDARATGSPAGDDLD
ncbi:hypothetical protein IAT38_003334 [Cryptococcus sp. DSM 104549]